MTHVAAQFHYDLKAWFDSVFPGAYCIGTTPLRGDSMKRMAVDIAWLRFDAEGLPAGPGRHRGAVSLRAPQGGCELTLALTYLDPPRADQVRFTLDVDTLGSGHLLRFTSYANVADLLQIMQEYFIEVALRLQHYANAYENMPRSWGETLTAGGKTYTNFTTIDRED